MSRSVVAPIGAQSAALSVAPRDLAGVLEDADALVDLMGRENLRVVAELADMLTASARRVGAREIEVAASAVWRIASGGRAVVLAGAMRDLTNAIARTVSQTRAEP